MGGVSVIGEGKRDEDVAKELLAKLRDQLEPVLRTMDELKAVGMQGQFQLGVDGFGRNVIQSSAVVKVIA